MSDATEAHTSPKHPNLAADPVLVDDHTVVVSLEGDLDLGSAPQLKSVLCEQLAAGRTRLVVDLERVGFMDSTALGVMVGVHRRLGSGERMAVAAAAPPVLRIFELTGLATGFPMFASREAALRYVAGEDPPASGHATPPLTADAALMLGIASTAMPFAQSVEDQAERWLRALRNHGESGAILASLGLSEATLEEPEGEADGGAAAPVDPDVVDTVSQAASGLAASRGAPKLTTVDVLQAVIDVYGATFYRVLAAHGVDPAELKAHMASAETAPAES